MEHGGGGGVEMVDAGMVDELGVSEFEVGKLRGAGEVHGCGWSGKVDEGVCVTESLCAESLLVFLPLGPQNSVRTCSVIKEV